MSQDLADLLRLGDNGEDTHGSRTTRTDQRVDLVHLGDESGPNGAAFLIGNSVGGLFIAGLNADPTGVPSP